MNEQSTELVVSSGGALVGSVQRHHAKLTAAQRRMLRAIDDYAEEGSGWAEVELQFLSNSAVPRYLEASICKSVGDALVRKALIVDNDGPQLTELGREALLVGRTEWRGDGRERSW